MTEAVRWIIFAGVAVILLVFWIRSKIREQEEEDRYHRHMSDDPYGPYFFT
jgi:hypothetical protein